MKITTLPSGNLEMRASRQDRAYLKRLGRERGYPLTAAVTESRFISEQLSFWCYEEIKPENAGALTDAPMIQDREGNVYAFMDYQLVPFLEKLAAGKPVIWTCGGKPEAKP